MADEEVKTMKLELLKPAGKPVKASIIEINKEARYVLMIDDTVGPYELESFCGQLHKTMKEVFGDDQKRVLIIQGGAVKIYEITDKE